MARMQLTLVVSLTMEKSGMVATVPRVTVYELSYHCFQGVIPALNHSISLRVVSGCCEISDVETLLSPFQQLGSEVGTLIC